MILKVFSKNPAPRHIDQITETLRTGGLIIIPTDGVYAFACAANQPHAIAKLSKIKGPQFNPSKLSFVFSDIGEMGEYTKAMSNDTFKSMKRFLPGPFTFILNAHNQVGKMFPGKKTIGVRIPDHAIPVEIVKALKGPILTASVHDDDQILDYTTDPNEIGKKWEGKVDLVIDGGYGNNEPSTIIDCTGKELTMIRQGLGDLEEAFG